MSARFGEDFSSVRVHVGSAAADATRALGAQAFTLGSNVIFGEGRYDPETTRGRRLLAHELAHVVQQRRGGRAARSPAIEPGADRAAAQVLAGVPRVEVAGASAPGIDCQVATSVVAPAQGAAPVPRNPLVDTMQQFMSIKPSTVASGIYEGVVGGKQLRLTQAQFDALRAKVHEQLGTALQRSQTRADMALSRLEGQRKVDEHHWVVAPIVKTLGGIRDPGMAVTMYTVVARTAIAQAGGALKANDLVLAAKLAGEAENAAERSAKLVRAYVEGIISTGETTVTVLEGVQLASELVLFACAIAATGGAAAGAAGALGIEVTAGSAIAATAITAGAAVVSEVGVGIVRAADGEKVDWGVIATHAAIQAIIARFGGSVGQKLARRLALNPLAIRYGTQRVVSVATSVLMAEGSAVFATTVEDTVRALRGDNVTWAQFGDHLLDRLTDPKALLMATVAGALGGPSTRPRTEPAAKPGPPSQPQPTKSPTDTNRWQDVNKALGIKGPSTKTKAPKTPLKPPLGQQQVTAEEAFRPTAQETAKAYANESPIPSGVRLWRSTGESPRGQTFQSASAQPPAKRVPGVKPAKGAKGASAPRGRGKVRGMQTAIQPDIAEAAAHKAAVARGEISLERPQGVNVKGRPDFITAARDSTGKLWIMVNDAKASGAAPPPKDFAPAAWDPHVKAAVARADVGNAALNAEIKAAYAAGRVRLRQIDVDYTPSGQGRIGGLSAPPPVPWGPMVRPVNFDVDLDDVEDE